MMSVKGSEADVEGSVELSSVPGTSALLVDDDFATFPASDPTTSPIVVSVEAMLSGTNSIKEGGVELYVLDGESGIVGLVRVGRLLILIRPLSLPALICIPSPRLVLVSGGLTLLLM